ncbi:MAG: SpoVR family protein [Candidatus Latescibacteria bacterium]|nr:SpoVR family protein [Candidatus Latescibacterota bacterium]
MAWLKKFPTELKLLKYEIEGYARACGLDFFEVIFEVVGYEEMNEIASCGGFPVRYPHWRFGMEYEQLAKSYTYGLQKIYEMVINNDPCYAYLLQSNDAVDQKLVMAHVYAHCDFFKNNLWFSQTNRKMMDEMANHGTRVRAYMERYGEEVVEGFIDACLSLEDLIDPHAVFIRRRRDKPDATLEEEREEGAVQRLRSKAYMDSYINPAEFLEEQKKQLAAEQEKEQRFPEDPEKDALWFLIEHAPLKSWQRDVLAMVREESYYFAPQRQTKIMNEGWASYWHAKILTEKALKDAELIDFADHHAGTMGMRPGRLNPYKLGMELFRDMEQRWDQGRFGSEYEACDDLEARACWDRQLGLGREKIFEVRRTYNDIGFIDAFLTEDFCREHRLFTYAYNRQQDCYEIESREFAKVKRQLLFSLTNFGRPSILVEDGNYRNRGELLLTHRYEGVGLKMDYAQDTLRNLQRLWGRPVHLETQQDDKRVLLSCEGEQVEVKAA